ncbi:PaaD-like protein (DUF59) involved in Fe-S cluster assembly [hydrothermal vent metagenome]|uniref:PaaD-like protein (DUF59) involved in Fe-S cluster assembly n=1 Tax=hydrothermal vent metagenome TaxID=652676 RepID=A0A3B1ANY5_9ZZZZ
MSFLDRFLKEQQDSKVVDNETKSSETTSEVVKAPPDFSPPLSEETRKILQEKVVERLREIYDPEIPVDIYELGLIYEVNVAEDANVEIIMTLTTPHCPVAESMPGDVQIRAQDVDGVRDVHVELVWDPPWTIYMMSEAARLEMGFM